MTDRLITIRTFMYPSEAFPFVSRLENENIQCLLDGENTVAVNPFLSNAIGGVKLQVAQADAEKALKIINDVMDDNNKNVVEDTIIVNGKKHKRILEDCPKCNSDTIYYEQFSFLKSIFGSFSKRDYYCKDCKYHWKQ